MIEPQTIEKALEVIRRGYAQYEYFFEQLGTPDWIVPLHEKGFFRDPPGTQRQGGSEFWLRWPESRYLQRVANKGPEEVADAFKSMADTDNPFVHSDLVDAALKMPGRLAAVLAAKERAWIEKSEFLGTTTPHDHGKLVAHLARCDESGEAIRLTRTLLDLLPDPRYRESDVEQEQPEGMEFLGLPRPQTKAGDWYREILQKDIPPLVRSAGIDAIAMLCDLLAKAISLSSLKPNEHKPYDYSTIWLPAVDRQERFPTSQVKQPLAIAVKEGATQIVQTAPDALEECVKQIEAREWHVFRRIVLCLLKEFKGIGGALVRERLNDRGLFDNAALSHEYFTLAGAALNELTEPERQVLVSWIDEGPELLRKDRFANEDDKGHYIKVWKCRRLHAIREYLTDEQRARYDFLLTEVGDVGTQDFARERQGPSRTGPTSPLAPNEIKEMPDGDLLRHLRDWEPTGDWASLSPEDLGLTLAAAVEDEPSRFASLAPRLLGLEPTYVRGVLQGLQQAARKSRGFEWQPTLELAQWVITEHGRESDSGEIPGDRDPGWGWTRKTIASLLCCGFHEGEAEIPLNLRNAVWGTLEPLCDDPEPTPEYEKEYGGSNMDAADLSLNVTRGQAFHAAIGYALWVRRNLQQREDYASKDADWIDEIPEVREVLEQHLDPAVDPSTAIRSVYGQHFPQMVWLDRKWARSIAQGVFGGPTSRDELQRAAWNTYIVFCRPYHDVLDVLEDVYAIAVAELDVSNKHDSHRFQPEARLADHLITFYIWGNLEEGRRRQILPDFFEKAWDSLRAHAIGFAGECAQSVHSERGEQVLARLRKLWTERLHTARQAPTVTEFSQELSAFGSWFTSGKFDEAWAIEQLGTVLQLTGKAEPDHEVVRHLAQVADDHLPQALQCLEALVRGDHEGYAVLGWKDEASELLRRCLDRRDADLSSAATDLVHRLGARGYRGFRGLLGGTAQSRQQPR